MEQKKACIYCRVSSTTDRQSNDRQIQDLGELASQQNLEIDRVFEEKVSGAKRNSERPVLTECLDYCVSHKTDILLISELSRLGRNVDEVLKNVMYAKEHRLNIHFQKEQLSIFGQDGEEHPFLTIFIAVLGTCASMERENIRFRLASGYNNARKNGVKVGRKEGYRKSDEELLADYPGVIKSLRKGYPVRMIARNEGVGVSTVMRLKKKFVGNGK